MTHTIGYRIESDDDIRLEYIEEENAPYFQPEWVDGYNSLNNTDDVDPDDVYSPDLIRVRDGSSYRYFRKTLIVPWKETSFRVSVAIDGSEMSNSFVYSGYNEFIKTRRVGYEIYATVETNKKGNGREGSLVLSYSSDSSVSSELAIKQELCDIKIGLLSCIVDDGKTMSEVLTPPDVFNYQFDTLIDPSDVKRQSLLFTVLATGYSNRFYIKDIAEYVSEGEIDDTYKYIDGKFYKSMLSWSNGRYVSKYAEVLVIDNIAYRRKPYDGAFEITVKEGNKLEIVNYGRVFMEDDASYVITLANYDDIDVTCEIKLSLKNVPYNPSLSL